MAGGKGNPDAPVRSEATIAKYCDWLDTGEGNRVLDIGCGDGAVVRVLSRRGLRAMGVDLKPWDWLKGFRHALGDGYRLPFHNESFDAVGSLAVLEHLERPEAFLTEMVRVVKVGGRLVVAAPNMYACFLVNPGDSVTHTGGIPRYAKNLVLHLRKQSESIRTPDQVSFDSLEPDMTSVPPESTDYGAVCATDPAVVRAVLKRSGVTIKHQSPSLEYPESRLAVSVSKAVESFPVVRDLFGGIFIVGEKVRTSPPAASGAPFSSVTER
ncbi:MAG: class I SAM-dependent methyltransferase [Dehalococcoidia bacterium]